MGLFYLRQGLGPQDPGLLAVLSHADQALSARVCPAMQCCLGPAVLAAEQVVQAGSGGGGVRGETSVP